MEIPPKTWGAVEILIWDYYTYLIKLGHQVVLVNNEDPNEIIRLTNGSNPDFVHVHYDEYYDILDCITCPNKVITSHFGYLASYGEYVKFFSSGLYKLFANRIARKLPWVTGKIQSLIGYKPIFDKFILGKHQIFCLSPEIAKVYRMYGYKNELTVIHNGARHDLFNFNEIATYPDRSIYLAKIDFRKRQYLYQGIPSLYFAGVIADKRFNSASSNFLGAWGKEYLYQHLTDYANLVLLSDGEAHALVCCEALMAGLGLVVSEYAAANLDTSLPFIDVIPKNKLSDVNYVEKIIIENREKSLKYRKQIRDYACREFAWENIIRKYSAVIEEICNK